MAETAYIKHSAVPLSEFANRNLQEIHTAGLKNPLTLLDVMDLAYKSFPIINSHMVYCVLCFDAPEFDFPTYESNDSQALLPPPPIHQLPSGHDHITLQYLLGTVSIPEASYDDNSQLIKEWLHQLHLDAKDVQINLGLKKVLAWVGDQLTVDQLHNLFRFHAEDANSFDRLDWMVPVFGWLHLMMAYTSTLHKQYLGTSKGHGLSQAFNITNKGLEVTSIKGPFHHDLTEALYHVAQAHICEDWLILRKVDNLKELWKDHRSEEHTSELQSP